MIYTYLPRICPAFLCIEIFVTIVFKLGPAGRTICDVLSLHGGAATETPRLEGVWM